MKSDKQSHILNASSNLLGICFLLITGIKLTNNNLATYADEIGILAAFCFLAGCLLSYLSLRTIEAKSILYEHLADYAFLLGLFTLFCAVLIFAVQIR